MVFSGDHADALVPSHGRLLDIDAVRDLGGQGFDADDRADMDESREQRRARVGFVQRVEVVAVSRNVAIGR